MYGFVTFVCIFIFVDLCYNENNFFLKIILFSYLYELASNTNYKLVALNPLVCRSRISCRIKTKF